MIVNTTVFTKKDLQFAEKRRRKAPRIVFALILGLVCGILLLILNSVMLYNAVSSGKEINVFLTVLIYVMGVLLICWSVFFNKLKVALAFRRQSVKAPRLYEFSDEGVLCRLSFNGIDSEERYPFSLMEKYYEADGALYVTLTVDKIQRFLIVHNDSYSEGSSGELKALLEKNGICK